MQMSNYHNNEDKKEDENQELILHKIAEKTV